MANQTQVMVVTREEKTVNWAAGIFGAPSFILHETKATDAKKKLDTASLIFHGEPVTNVENRVEVAKPAVAAAVKVQEVTAPSEASSEQESPNAAAEAPQTEEKTPASPPNEEISSMAEKVMDVLETYFWKPKDDSGHGYAHWPGRTKFKEHAMHWIQLNEPVHMVLPAFPFKSSNPDKVTGTLPDFAEYLALSRLNQLCIDVRKVYPGGGQITIATDGVAFSDLLMIKDKDVWEYGQAIRVMVQENFFDNNLVVRHAMEILGFVKPDELTEESFYRTMDPCRNAIRDQFCQPEEAIRKLIDEDPDTCMTYTGMKTFCKVDLNNSELRRQMPSRKAYLREMSKLAAKMMARSEGFGYLIRDVMPMHIRLSMHPSSGAAKLSICLVPQLPGSIARAPWMACIAANERGEYQTAHAKEVCDTHELVYMNGQPWLYRQRTSLYQLQEPDVKQAAWTIEHVFPSGLRVWPVLSPDRTPVMTAQNEIREKLRELAAWQPVEVIRMPTLCS